MPRESAVLDSKQGPSEEALSVSDCTEAGNGNAPAVIDCLKPSMGGEGRSWIASGFRFPAVLSSGYRTGGGDPAVSYFGEGKLSATRHGCVFQQAPEC
jgi:hypothetical protein